METALSASRPVPRWLGWFLALTWYERLAWITEFVLFGTFALIAYDQFAEGQSRAGWIMILLMILFCGPGLWLLLGYRPTAGSKFGKYDIGAIICLVVWSVMLFYFLAWTVDFQPGFEQRFDISAPK
jgi:hypothetical protein